MSLNQIFARFNEHPPPAIALAAAVTQYRTDEYRVILDASIPIFVISSPPELLKSDDPIFLT